MAEWAVHEGAEGKTLRMDIYGGVLSLKRREDGKLVGKWFAQPIPAAAAREEDQNDLDKHSLTVNIPLHHIELVEDAKVEAVRLLDNALSANGHSFHKSVAKKANPDEPEEL